MFFTSGSLSLGANAVTSPPTDPEDPFKITEETRSLGLVICRGTTVVLICPADSMEQIANPFVTQEAI